MNGWLVGAGVWVIAVVAGEPPAPPPLRPAQDAASVRTDTMNLRTLSDHFTGTDAELRRLRRLHSALKATDGLDAAVVTIECGGEAGRLADLIHAHLPGVRVVGSADRPEGEEPTDFDAYRLQVRDDLRGWLDKADESGENVILRLPSQPNAAVSPVQARSLLWRVWRRGIAEIEWTNIPKESPVGNALRQGIADAERLQVLRDGLDAMRNRKNAEPHRPLLDTADALLRLDFLDNPSLEWNALDVARKEAEGLIVRFQETLPGTERWDAGAYTYAKAVEVRLATVRTARRNLLRQHHLDACERLNVAPLSQEEWDSLWQSRILFRQDFDADGDWEGQIVTDNVPPGSRRSLAGNPIEGYHARFIRVGVNYDHARAATTTWIRFKYFLSKPAPVEIMVFDLTQEDNHAWNLQNPTVGKWEEVTLKITGAFYRKDGSEETMRAGDAVDDLFFSAGVPGDPDLTFLLDDVVLIGLD